MVKFWGIIVLGILVYAIALFGAVLFSKLDPLNKYRWQREKLFRFKLARFMLDYGQGLLIGLFFVLATVATGALSLYTTNTTKALPKDWYALVSENLAWLSNGFLVIAGLTAVIWILAALGTTIIGNKGARGRGLGLMTSLVAIVFEFLYGAQWYHMFIHVK